MNNTAIIASLFTTFRDDNKDRFAIYCELLKDIPTEFLKKAVMKCLATCKFLPSVAEILEECKALKEEITGERQKDWDEAWEEIYKGWCEGGTYKPQPKWSTPEIAHVIKCFGWQSLLEAPADQTMAIRAQMKVMYETACKRKKTHEANQNVLQGRSGFESIGGAMQNLLGSFGK